MTQTKLPNILITGTPGSGKTTTSSLLIASCQQFNSESAEGETNASFKLLHIGDLVKEKGFHHGFDQEFQAFLLDEDKVLDELEPELQKGGCIVDHHTCDFFPERWFDLVVCLTCDNTILYDRLKARDYPQNKIEENVQCEIFQVVLQQAYDSYRKDIIAQLPSNTLEEMESNVERIEEWIQTFLSKN